MDWGGPAAQIGEEPEVGGQVPDQNSGGPGQPEEKEKLDRGAGRGLLGRWKVGGGLAGGSGAVGGGSRCLGTLLRSGDRQRALPAGLLDGDGRDGDLDQGTALQDRQK